MFDCELSNQEVILSSINHTKGVLAQFLPQGPGGVGWGVHCPPTERMTTKAGSRVVLVDGDAWRSQDTCRPSWQRLRDSSCRHVEGQQPRRGSLFLEMGFLWRTPNLF